MLLPKELKEKWLEALRSGEWKQGRHRLYQAKVDGYCCLGVLEMICDGKVEKEEYGTGLPRGTPSTEWYETHGIVVDTKYGDQQISDLVNLNDGYTEEDLDDLDDIRDLVEPQPFPVIADWIEKNVGVTNE